MFSGLVNNGDERVVQFTIDPSVVTDGTKTVMSESYYTLSSSSEFVVPVNEEQGYVSIEIDSAAFLADPKSLTGEYVIPFRLTGSNDVDSINSTKDYMVLSISYWAKQHGNYYYSGRTVRKSSTETDTVTYENDPTIIESIRELVTIGPNKLKVVADKSAGSKDPGVAFNMVAPSAGSGEVSLSSDNGATIQVSGNGTSLYDADARTFYLKYKYTDGDFECEASDTLVFRNRVRDIQSDGQGVNEWR